MNFKKLSKVLLVLLVAVVSVGCNSTKETGDSSEVSTSLADIKDKGEFIIGLDDTFAPMGFRDNGELVGFDIDLANAVGEKLDVKVTFQPISWEAKEMELATGKIDCIWNGLSVTPQREAAMSLSDVYLANNIIVMTNEGVTIASKEELVNYKIGIQSGSSALEAAKSDALYETFKDNITDYPTYDEVVLDMQAGRLDCMIIDEVFGEYKNAKMGSIYGVADFNFGEDFYAIGFRKADTDLTNDVNKAIEDLVADGTAGEISNKWFGRDLVYTKG